MLVCLKKAFTAAAILTTVMFTQQALAHAHLAEAAPAAKSHISDSPKEITLTFTEGIEAGFSGAAITEAAGKPVETGKATVNSNDPKILHVPVNSALKAGDYRVNWHVLSVDGHKTKGSYNFTVK